MFDIAQLHFIRPWALIFLLPAAILLFFYWKKADSDTNWSRLIDPHLLSWLMPKSEPNNNSWWKKVLLLVFWLFSIIALSGPSWQKLPQPIYSSLAARVVVLDLSLSMDAQDVSPSRISRARYKLTDLLNAIEDGQTGLVVYAGDGFILSPLTTDTNTLSNLTKDLSTGIMPIKGSHPERGITKAIELLNNAGQASGEIIWITDGAEEQYLKQIEEDLSATDYQLRIWTVGTQQGAPIQTSSQGFLKDSAGNIVIAKLNYAQMIKFANKVNALMTPLTDDNTDIQLLTKPLSTFDNLQFKKTDNFADLWQDSGYWLVLVLLPICLLSFRYKSLLTSLCFVSIIWFSGSTHTAHASVLDKLFLNQDQQGQKLLQQKEYSKAQTTFNNERWKSIAAYKNGDYEGALSVFNQLSSANDYYNQGNALALSQQYKKAIEAYSKALELETEHQDADYNKSIVEKLLQQQEQEEKNKSNDPGEQPEDSNEQQEPQQSEENKKQQEKEGSNKKEQQQSKSPQQQKQMTPEELQKQYSEQEKEQELKQWLKRIPDDPGGLLRNKMRLEYSRRGHKYHTDKKW